METIGDRIKRFAKEKYKTVRNLEEAMGIGGSSLSNYINGRSKPGHELQEKFRKVGCDVEWLMTGKEGVGAFVRAVENAMNRDEVRLSGVGTIDPPAGTRIKLMLSPVHAGDPSVAYEDIDAYIDVSKFHNEHTFYVRVMGESMIGAGINEGDMLLVDRSKEPKNQSIVVVQIGNQVSVKRLKKNGQEVLLTPENPDFNPIPFTAETKIIGVVTRIDRYL